MTIRDLLETEICIERRERLPTNRGLLYWQLEQKAAVDSHIHLLVDGPSNLASSVKSPVQNWQLIEPTTRLNHKPNHPYDQQPEDLDRLACCGRNRRL